MLATAPYEPAGHCGTEIITSTFTHGDRHTNTHIGARCVEGRCSEPASRTWTAHAEPGHPISARTRRAISRKVYGHAAGADS